MTTIEKIVTDIVFIAVNIGLAKWQANRFDKRQKRLSHSFWAVAYGGFITGWTIVDLLSKSFTWDFIWLWLAGIAIHFPLFSSMLNYFRTPRRPIFYHNTSDTTGSKWDLWVGKWYVEVLFASVVAWIGLQFLIF